MDQQPTPPEAEPVYAHDIDMQTLVQEWNTAKQYTDKYTTDFPSLDNIADGIPVTHENGAPYVGDTTIAGLVRSIPRSAIQQLPTFGVKLNGTKNSINAQLAAFLLRDCIFNEDTFGKGLLSTLQIGGEEALKHGYAPFMCVTGNKLSDFGTSMKLLHYSDVAPEPGIQDFNESGYFYVSANLVKSRLKKILRAAEKNPNTTWNVHALRRLEQMEPEVNPYSIYQSDARKNGGEQAPTYTFVTRIETGKGAQFVTFCPQIDDEPLRVMDNKSKFGYPRVLSLVIDPAPLTPFGVSRVRLASPNQNLMNAYYQNIGSLLIYNSDPALLKRGRFTKPVQLKRRQVWETLDQNATVELKTMGTDALQQFVPMAKQMSAQIQNIMGVPQGTVNADSNNLGFSKTAPGVKMQQQFTDMSTNQITNILENLLRQYGLVALDTYIAEQTIEDNVDPETGEKLPNEDTLVLDDEAKNAINRIAQDLFVPEPDTEADPDGTLGIMTEFVPPVGDNNEITIDWNDFYDNVKTWSVEIELSLGKDELEEKKRADTQDMLTVLMQNADPNDTETQTKIRELQDRLLEDTVPESKRLKPTPPEMPFVPPTGAPTETSAGPQMTMNQ